MDEIFIILFLIILNGIFSMSEVAVISARKSKLNQDVKTGSRSARIALKLANEPDWFLSTIQIGITLIGILTGIYSGDALAGDFSKVLEDWGMNPAYAYQVGQVLIIVAVTFVTIIFGELVPKRIGLALADRAARIIAIPMYFLSKLAMPFVWILSNTTFILVKILGIDKHESKVTEDEIRSMIQEGTESGEVQEVEQDIMERVFVLGDLKVSSIMTHRMDLVVLDVDMTAEEIEKIIQENLYEAYPVVDGDMDRVKGLITLKDLILTLHRSDFCLAEVLKPSTFFPETMSVYKALEQMKQKRISRALVCDEFGSLCGLVTLKDILEGLVGSIDEPQEEADIVECKDGTLLVNGQCPFYDFLAYIDLEELYVPNQYSTVGGLMIDLLEHIPTEGESINWNGYTFEVVDMDGIRIDKILVTAPPEEKTDED